MHIRSRALVTLAAAVAALAVLLPAPAAFGAAAMEGGDDDPTVVWGVRPADNAQGTGRANYSYLVQPGETVQDAFVAINHDDQPLTIRVYAADGFLSATGQLDLLGANDPQKDVGAWVELDATEVTIKPGEGVEIPFTLTVPADASPGDHTGGIVSSLSSPGDAQIEVERRLGSRIHVRVDGELEPTLAITSSSVSHPGSTDLVPTGDAVVRFTVQNSGNTRLGGTVKLRVAGPFGAFARTVEVPDLPELLPGSSHEVEVEVPDMPAALFITADEVVTPVVVDPDGSPTTTSPQPVHASAWGWAPPWIALLVLALILGWIARLVVRSYRRRRALATEKQAGERADDPTTGSGDGGPAGADTATEAEIDTEAETPEPATTGSGTESASESESESTVKTVG